MRHHTLYRNESFSTKHKLVIHFIVAAILLILIGKSFFVESDYFVLYVYGIAVSFVLGLTFFIAVFKYQDPAVLAEMKEKENLAKGIHPETPLVSCMVAVYNEAAVIEQCILSLIDQTYSNKEIIFVNDGSTDDTAKVLNEYAKTGKIRVIHQKNAGKKRALGRAMREARGSIFAFSDSDSVWATDALEKVVRIFNVFPDVGGGKRPLPT